LDIRQLYRVKFAVIGEKTAEVTKRHSVNMDYMPEIYNARELASGLQFCGGGVMLFRALGGTPLLASTLRERGFLVDDVPAYETVCESPETEHILKKINRGEVDFAAFTSASTVRCFVNSMNGLYWERYGFYSVCIGEETATEAEKHGLRVMISESATTQSMIECIKTHYRRANEQSG